MTVGNPYKVTKKIKLHTNPLYDAEVVKTGKFERETTKWYIFDKFKVKKANVVKIEKAGKYDTETINEFVKRLKEHYPHTISICNTIDKEVKRMLEEEQ